MKNYKVLLLMWYIILSCFYVQAQNYVETQYGKLYCKGMVDLGLSVKWAACNLGGNYPEDCCNYYAWGEMETKKSYSEENSLCYNKNIFELRKDGIIDENNNLTAKYDVATQKLGSAYRMPTSAEQQELIDNCTWIWGDYKESLGYYVVGKNGNCIFLSADGYRYGTDLYYIFEGLYWSSTLNADTHFLAYCLYFSSRDSYVGYNKVYVGKCVRPVSE